MELVQNHTVSPYRDLPLSQLQESPTNPRRRYNKAALQELAAIIKAQGILAPILVRELEPQQFQVIAGSRRFRAAGIAELPEVPVRVVEMTDAQVLETQCVENLQREDVHPLEEGNAFASMLREHYDVATIAAKIGKPPAFVVNRIQLTQLIAPIAEAFLDDKLTIGHATLIAKVPAERAVLDDVGRFRTVAVHDLAGTRYHGHASLLERDVKSLVTDGLLERRKMALDSRGRTATFLALTNRRKASLKRIKNDQAATSQAVYHGFVKPREIPHDAGVYRMYLAEAEKTEREGGRIQRIVLDYETKEARLLAARQGSRASAS